jgi:hypothetical protein
VALMKWEKRLGLYGGVGRDVVQNRFQGLELVISLQVTRVSSYTALLWATKLLPFEGGTY